MSSWYKITLTPSLSSHPYMAGILLIRHKTLSNQSIHKLFHLTLMQFVLYFFVRSQASFLKEYNTFTSDQTRNPIQTSPFVFIPYIHSVLHTTPWHLSRPGILCSLYHFSMLPYITPWHLSRQGILHSSLFFLASYLHIWPGVFIMHSKVCTALSDQSFILFFLFIFLFFPFFFFFFSSCLSLFFYLDQSYK